MGKYLWIGRACWPTSPERSTKNCSRAIWFAFTRAGLPYNTQDEYIPTAHMAGDKSMMAEQFDRCDNENLQLGDIFVYCDNKRGDGHTVMVIDPEKRIAWGSHGWDGNAKKLTIEPDNGVEYQLIKYKKDWERWDRPTMTQDACWRYRAFQEEVETTCGLPGIKALVNACRSTN